MAIGHNEYHGVEYHRGETTNSGSYTMALPNDHARIILDRILNGKSPEDALKCFEPRDRATDPLPPRLTSTADHSRQAMLDRRELLAGQGIVTCAVAGEDKEIEPELLSANIENQIGMVRMPVGIVGPLRVNGAAAHGDFYVPMATTEGALVASFHRGALITAMCGGVSACCLTESVTRAPCFVFTSMRESGAFLAWLLPRFGELQQLVGKTTSFGKLIDLQTSVLGKEVYLLFEFTTGDAGGQNMVTLATQAICEWIIENVPVKVEHWFIDGNMSGDKKATMQAFVHARGKKVVAECTLGSQYVRRFLHTTPEQMFRYWQVSALGGVQSGSIGIQGHYANGLAAIYIACGQDPACVAEAAVGVTRVDLTDDGDLYISVALPNLICGTVGGGTHLPTARECLEMIGCYGSGKARKLAEIICATALCGEISIIGAMAAGDFASAHGQYGRKRDTNSGP